MQVLILLLVDPNNASINLYILLIIMTTLIATLEGRTFHITLDSVQESPQAKDIVLRASSHQPDLKEGELTNVLFDLKEAALRIFGDGQVLVRQGVKKRLSFNLFTSNGHSVGIDIE